MLNYCGYLNRKRVLEVKSITSGALFRYDDFSQIRYYTKGDLDVLAVLNAKSKIDIQSRKLNVWIFYFFVRSMV